MPTTTAKRHEMDPHERAFIDAYESAARTTGYVIEGDNLRLRAVEAPRDIEAAVAPLIGEAKPRAAAPKSKAPTITASPQAGSVSIEGTKGTDG